ncbi:glycoside hydrolase superfamily [Mycena capillaripes]|nr:glycoside hydrolase superfamily [Mycena capillaripes]
MVSFYLACLAAVASAFLAFPCVNSLPTNVTALDGLSPQAWDILAQDTPAAPHWVAYGDKFVSGTTGPPPTLLSFLLVEGAWDKAFKWTTYTDADRATIKAQYAADGIKLMVSAFGSSDVSTSSGVNPITMATTMANWVKQYNLDGIDVDYEDFNAFDAEDGISQLRTILPQGTYIITHARAFSPNTWGGGGYLKVHQSVGNLIDWYNIQLLTASSSTWSGSAVFQIAVSGVPLSKIVIGKPAGTGDGNSGFMSLAPLLNQGWTGGAMAWETVRASSWPV